MRVALVYKRFAESGGSERQVAMLARDLAAAGHEPHVFVAQARAPAPEGVHLHVMPLRPPGALAQLLAFSHWARRAVRSAGAFDLTHAFGRTEGQDIYRVGGGCHRTYLEHAHALEKPAWLRPLLRSTPLQRIKANLEERALRAASTRAVITNSRMVKDDLVFRYDLDPARVHVVRNGVDLQRFTPLEEAERAAGRRALSLEPDDRVALFLGTGYARKGLDPTLRALPLLLGQHPEARLLVAGRDGASARWKRRAQQLGVAAAVHWLGPVSDPQRLYPLADVTVLPAAYDPAANGTLESLACGVPAITSAMNGAGEIVTAGITGTVVPTPVHPADVADALCHWLDDVTEGTRAQRRHSASSSAQSHPASRSCAHILDVYRAVVAERHATTPHGAPS